MALHVRRVALGAVSVAIAWAMTAACVGDEPLVVSGRDAGASPGDAGAGAEESGSPPVDASPDAPSGPDGASPSVACASHTTSCPVPSTVCCDEADGGGACLAESSCTVPFGKMACDSKDDCPDGMLCCASTADQILSSYCASACAELTLCRSVSDCPRDPPESFTQCGPLQPEYRPAGYTICQQ